MTTLWAAMLSAWLAAGQAAPPSAATDRPESQGAAGERAAAPAPERAAGA